MVEKTIIYYSGLINRYEDHIVNLEDYSSDEWNTLEFDVFSIEWSDVSTDLAELFSAASNNVLTVEQLKKYKDLFQRTQSIRPLLKKLDLEDPLDSLPADAQ